MASTKISQLTEKTTPAGTEELVVNDSGVSKKIKISNLPDNDTTYSVGDGGLTEINFTSAKDTKLTGIETGATADQTGAEIKTAYEAEADTNAFTDAEKTKLSGIATGAEVNVQSDWNAVSGDAQILNKPNVQYTSAIPDATAIQTGLATSTQITKLDGIEANADVTDTANVTSAGALMDSEVTNLAQVKAFDSSDYATAAHNHSGVYEPADADILKADTADTLTASFRGTVTTDNDGSFDMNVTNNFKCTPSGNFTLTFTNITAGQSGFILLVNTGGHTVSAHANTKVDANLLATVSTAGTYLLSYFPDGTNVYMTNSAVYT